MCSCIVELFAIYATIFFVCVNCNSADTIKIEDIKSMNVLNQMKQEIESLKARITSLENITIESQCIESTNSKITSLQFSDKWDKYDIGTILNDNTIDVYIQDTISKNIYWNEFTSKQLQHSGFSDLQVFNLENISNFILKSTHTTEKQFHITGNNRLKYINLMIHDKYFGDQHIKLQLPLFPRKQEQNSDNTIVTLIGTGSGTPDISFVLNAKLVNTIVGNYNLLSIEPKNVFKNKQFVMGYRATLLTSSNDKNCNGYLQSDTKGQSILLSFLKMVPLKDTITAHIYERNKQMRQDIFINDSDKNTKHLSHLDENCTAPIVGPDSWEYTEYDIQDDDCGFFTGLHQTDNNCYAYGTDIATNTFPQPGRGSGHEWDFNTCKDMIAAAERDGLIYIGSTLTNYSYGPDNGHYVALYIWPDTNFHWARMDYNGSYNSNHIKDNVPKRWSHKPGGTSVKIVDNNGDCIGDIYPCVLPSDADMSPWSQFCGYMVSIPSKLTIN